LPIRQLPVQHFAEALAKNPAWAAAFEFAAGRMCEIDQEQRAFLAGEALDDQLDAAARFFTHGDDTADEIAFLIPRLQGKAGAAGFETEVVLAERERFFAGLED